MFLNPSYVSPFTSAVSLIGSSSSVDVVRIVDNNGGQLFQTARIMRASVNNDSNLFSHPLEDGNSITDFKVELPISIQLGVIIPTSDYTNTYRNLKLAKQAGTEFIIQTRADSYEHMVIKSMPHEESQELGDCLGMTLTFREVEWFKPSIETLPRKEVASKPASKANGVSGVKSDADTVKMGQKNPSEVTDSKKQSILSVWMS